MTALRIAGGEILTPYTTYPGGVLLARDGVIAYAGPGSGAPAERADVEVDAAGLLVCPGFVDLQVNGGGGALLTDRPDDAAIEAMTRAHVRYGTTALLPTVVTSGEETLVRALAAVREAAAAPPRGARVLGAHLEGPFISQARRGAHDPRFIREPDPALFRRLLDAAGGTLRLVTLAPELPGARDLIAGARAVGVTVALGHTDATYGEAIAAINDGVALGTHLFNGMRPLHHREPGVIGALLMSDAVCGVIADGVHVDPVLLDLAYRATGPFGLALVTDALDTPGDGLAALGSRGLDLRDGAWYLADGTLAGSALTMDRAVRNMRDASLAGLIECVQMATATPAAALGLQDEVGVLQPGARADIVLIDRDVNVRKVFVDGDLAFES